MFTQVFKAPRTKLEPGRNRDGESDVKPEQYGIRLCNANTDDVLFAVCVLDTNDQPISDQEFFLQKIYKF